MLLVEVGGEDGAGTGAKGVCDDDDVAAVEGGCRELRDDGGIVTGFCN